MDERKLKIRRNILIATIVFSFAYAIGMFAYVLLLLIENDFANFGTFEIVFTIFGFWMAWIGIKAVRYLTNKDESKATIRYVGYEVLFCGLFDIGFVIFAWFSWAFFDWFSLGFGIVGIILSAFLFIYFYNEIKEGKKVEAANEAAEYEAASHQIEDLAKLNDLYQSGAITESEFKRLKERILEAE
jgi:uncharacterized membrane protein